MAEEYDKEVEENVEFKSIYAASTLIDSLVRAYKEIEDENLRRKVVNKLESIVDSALK